MTDSRKRIESLVSKRDRLQKELVKAWEDADYAAAAKLQQELARAESDLIEWEHKLLHSAGGSVQ